MYELYPQAEVKTAREARQIQERLFLPSDYALTKSMTSGSFVNCRATPQAVKLAKDIYSLSEAIIAGKSKRRKPVPATEIPVSVHMRQVQMLYCDIYFSGDLSPCCCL